MLLAWLSQLLLLPPFGHRLLPMAGTGLNQAGSRASWLDGSTSRWISAAAAGIWHSLVLCHHSLCMETALPAKIQPCPSKPPGGAAQSPSHSAWGPCRAHPTAPGNRAPEGNARIPCVPEAAGTPQMAFPAPRQALCSPLPSLARGRDPLAAALQTGDPICTLGLAVDGIFLSPRNYCSFQAALGTFFLPTPPVLNATDM